MMPESDYLSISEIEPNLFIGNTVAGAYIPALREHRITAIICLESNKNVSWTRPGWKVLYPESQRLFVACLDSRTQDMQVHLEGLCAFINGHLSRPALDTELSLLQRLL
jgi:hypothetical protein